MSGGLRRWQLNTYGLPKLFPKGGKRPPTNSGVTNTDANQPCCYCDESIAVNERARFKVGLGIFHLDCYDCMFLP